MHSNPVNKQIKTIILDISPRINSVINTIFSLHSSKYNMIFWKDGKVYKKDRTEGR